VLYKCFSLLLLRSSRRRSATIRSAPSDSRRRFISQRIPVPCGCVQSAEEYLHENSLETDASRLVGLVPASLIPCRIVLKKEEYVAFCSRPGPASLLGSVREKIPGPHVKIVSCNWSSSAPGVEKVKIDSRLLKDARDPSSSASKNAVELPTEPPSSDPMELSSLVLFSALPLRRC
jgi:hypothetical protein